MITCCFFSSSTTTVIHRPHGDSMLIIRPSVNKNQLIQSMVQQTMKKPPKPCDISTNVLNLPSVSTDLDAASSSTAGKFSINKLLQRELITMYYQVTFKTTNSKYKYSA